MWQRALALAAQSAKHDDNAARERLAQIGIENEVRAPSFALRERKFEITARARERALADSRDHLISTLKMLESDRVALRAREARITNLESQIEEHRRQLASVIARAIAKNRAVAIEKPRRRIQAKPKRRAIPKKRVPSKRTPSRAKR
jgi:hypothetical protein